MLVLGPLDCFFDNLQESVRLAVLPLGIYSAAVLMSKKPGEMLLNQES